MDPVGLCLTNRKRRRLFYGVLPLSLDTPHATITTEFERIKRAAEAWKARTEEVPEVTAESEPAAGPGSLVESPVVEQPALPQEEAVSWILSKVRLNHFAWIN